MPQILTPNRPRLLLALLLTGAWSVACSRQPEPPPSTPVTAPAEAAAPPASPPPGWAGLLAQAARLRMTDRFADAIALFEKAAQEHPDSWEAHFELGRSHLDRANRDGSLNETERVREYETAIGHYRRALDRGGDAEPRVFVELLAIYDRTALNRPAEGEPIARAMLARHPARHESYDWLARLLSTLGRHHEAAQVFVEASRVLEGAELRASAESMEAHVRLFDAMGTVDQRAVRDAAAQGRQQTVEPGR